MYINMCQEIVRITKKGTSFYTKMYSENMFTGQYQCFIYLFLIKNTL